jgi:hypothetical protein
MPQPDTDERIRRLEQQVEQLQQLRAKLEAFAAGPGGKKVLAMLGIRL